MTAPAVCLLAVLLTACNREKHPDCTPGECGVSQPCGDDGLYDYDGDGYASDNDCDEASPNACEINPGAAETCDDLDNDCDGNIDGSDDDLQATDNDVYEFYLDRDGDGNASDTSRKLCIDYVPFIEAAAGAPCAAVLEDDEVAFYYTVVTHPDIRSEDEIDGLDDYTSDRQSIIRRYLTVGHEQEQLGDDWKDYFDQCDMPDDRACETTYPQCEYSSVEGDPYNITYSDTVVDSECTEADDPSGWSRCPVE